MRCWPDSTQRNTIRSCEPFRKLTAISDCFHDAPYSSWLASNLKPGLYCTSSPGRPLHPTLSMVGLRAVSHAARLM